MKWLLRLSGKAKPKTPLPPKPYVDVHNVSKHMSDPRYTDITDIKNIDPEKPHWEDPRFDSRETKPFFDFFGYNRDWSWTMFKLVTILLAGLFYAEIRMIGFAEDMSVSSAPVVVAVPEYARDNKATEEELKAAGFAFVGVKSLDHIGTTTKKLSQ